MCFFKIIVIVAGITMKRFFFTCLLLVVFGGVSSIGFLEMNPDLSMAHKDCLAAAMARITCPDQTNALAFLNFHANILKNFSSVPLGVNLTILLLLVLGLVPRLILWMRRFGYYAPYRFVSCLHLLSRRTIQFLSALFFWIALHEHSPTSL